MRPGAGGSGRRIPLAVLAAACAGVAAAGCAPARVGAALTRAPAAPFVLTFWCGPPLGELDDARAAEIAAAGFTTIGPPCTGAVNPALNSRALAVAERHGLRMWVRDDRISPASVMSPGWPSALDEAVAAYRGATALDGYFVADEPVVAQFHGIAAVVAALRAADPDRLAYVNLLPDYVPAANLGAANYKDYVEQFIATVRPRMLSYDYYPFGHLRDRGTFFANLAVMRAAALRHDLPFLLIVLAMPHGPYRDPTAAELAWQANHALAYGARGVSYFAYWTPPPDGQWTFRSGLIEDGGATMRYSDAARLNRDLRNLGEALTRFESIAVADSHGEVGAPFPIGPIEGIDGGPVTVGLFGDGNGRLAVLLVNRSYRDPSTARLRLRHGAPAPDSFDSFTATWEPGGSPSYVLPPGGARLLRWS